MTRYLIALLVGLLVGAAAFLALLYYNPLTQKDTLSPLSVSEEEVTILNYSAVAVDSLVYTNDGESTVQPFPERVGELWEASIVDSEMWVTELQNSRGMPVGLGIKFSTRSEQTELIRGDSLPLPASLTALDTSAYGDGVYTLQFSAVDQAGLQAEARVRITIDNTAPLAAFTLPAEGDYIKGPQAITGTASDANFAEYRLDVAPGDKTSASR